MPAGVTSRRPPLKGNSPESIRFRARLSENIRRLSLAKGLVREDLSRLTGLSLSRLGDIGEATTTASGLEVTVIAQTLGVSVDELVKGCLGGGACR